MSTQGTGTVKWYNPEKAYGFIATEDGQEFFVHRNGIADGRPWLIDGQGVAFTIRQGMKGSEAAEVRVTQDVEGVPPGRQRFYESDRSGDGGGGGSYGGDGGGYRSAAPRRPREAYAGPLPSGAVPAKVMRIDPSGRFLFAHVASVGDDVYVHSSLFAGMHLQPGDEIDVIVERSDRGLRARSIVR
jgi:cold shock CspA family protein